MITIYVIAIVGLLGLAASVRILKQYERGVQFRLGRVVHGARGPGLIFIIPLVDRVHRVSLRIVTMPIQSQGIITRDNVSIDVSAVAYYRVDDAIRSVVAIENVAAANNQIAQTTLRSVVGRHSLDETLAETDKINQNIREILDVQTEEWGVKVTVVDKNSMIIFPAPLMSTIGELGAFLSREAAAASREASGPPLVQTPALTEADHPNGAPLPA